MNYRKSAGFTLLELIFVIIILGIVASIGSTIVSQLFENYIVQRAVQRVSLKTELAAEQISNRLKHAIRSSVIVRDGRAGAPRNAFTKLSDIPAGAGQRHTQILEWIGYDNDSFSSAEVPGWSGYCDVTSTINRIQGVAGFAPAQRNLVYTPGSQLAYANTVIQNLSGNANPRTLANTALLFATNGLHDNAGQRQRPDCYGYDGNNFACIHTIQGNVNQTILQTDNNLLQNTYISPIYQLAWSAYAIVPVNIRRNPSNNSALFDLELRYNYQPWDNIQYDARNTPRSILIRNVTSFKYSELAGTIRFKLCATEQIGGNSTDDVNATNISVCKEKVVLR